MVQIGDEMDGWAIPFERAAFIVDDVVRRFEGEYVMHNATFDAHMLEFRGAVKPIPTNKIHDTRIMAHVLSSTGPLGLKPLSQRFVDAGATAAQEALNDGIGKHGGWTWANVPVDYEPYWVYAALDTVLTKRLKNHLWPQVQTIAPNSYSLEMLVMWVCAKMERKGAKIDRQYTQEFSDKLEVYAGQVEDWVRQHYGASAGSDEAIVAILEREGVPLWKRTPSGKRYSLDKEVIGEIEHPLAKAVQGRRQAVKIMSTYLRHYLLETDANDRVHPSINTVGGTSKSPFESGGARGVRTGRMSMDSPNLQNVPIRTKEGKKIRNCFIVDDEETWIKCDFDQIEMRLFAHIADDKALIDAFVQAHMGGVDMFTRACRDIFQDQAILKSDDRRQYVKNGFYAILYGAGLEQFAKTAGIRHPDGAPDLGSANAFLVQLHRRYPGIKQLQAITEQDAMQRLASEGEAYVESPLTRRRFVADRGREYALMNYMVQGAAGEILKMKIVQADMAGLGDYMLFPVHDEIDFAIPTNDLPDATQTIKEVMNDDELLSVPVTSTMSLGDRWGDVKDEE
jgi:DNA polymerase-1